MPLLLNPKIQGRPTLGVTLNHIHFANTTLVTMPSMKFQNCDSLTICKI
jgi:hypothetical protein